MLDRRKAKRYSANYPLELGKNSAAEYETAIDISPEGVGFISKYPVKKGKSVKIELFLKAGRYSLKGIVVRGKRIREGIYRIGICFIEPDRNFVRVLAEEIEQIKHKKIEKKIYHNKVISFEDASREYLGV